MADKAKRLIVDFNTALKDFKGQPINETSGVPEIAAVLLRAGVPRGRLDDALMAMQRFIGEEPPEAKPLTVADIVVAALQGAPEEGVKLAEVKERGKIILRALSDDQPVELLEAQADIIRKVLEKRQYSVAIQCFVDELLQPRAENVTTLPSVAAA